MTTHKSLYDPTEATGAVDACKIGRRADLPFPRVNADIVLAVEPPSRVTQSDSVYAMPLLGFGANSKIQYSCTVL
jgi:hypothetical protein